MNGLATYRGLHPFEFMSGSDDGRKEKPFCTKKAKQKTISKQITPKGENK